MDFVERLERRRDIWWRRHIRLTDVRTYGPWIHARRDMSTRMHASDDDTLWRCCDAWPRKLLNKWNSHQFCVRHGVPVPDLYAYVRSARRLSLDSLPSRYVIRPLRGTARQGVLVMADGRDLLSQQPLAPSAVRARLASGRGHAAGPYLVEQFIEREDGSGRLPIEYKCHTFGSHVAAIQRTERAHEGDGGITHRFYRPDWSLFDDPMSTAVPLTRPVAAPPFLDALLETAAQLGQAIGTYVRVDMFGSCSGIVFNEFSSMPALRHPKFTPHCRELFGSLWDATFPDAL